MSGNGGNWKPIDDATAAAVARPGTIGIGTKISNAHTIERRARFGAFGVVDGWPVVNALFQFEKTPEGIAARDRFAADMANWADLWLKERGL